MTISELNRKLSASPQTPQYSIRIHAQITELEEKKTKAEKPYWRATLQDGTGEFTLNVWDNHPDFSLFSPAALKQFIAVEGTFKLSEYGVEPTTWKSYNLDEQEIEQLLNGCEERRAQIASDFDSIKSFCENISDPTLSRLTLAFLERFGEQFKRAGAARGNHHARRGGLVEHTASMMRIAAALPTPMVFPEWKGYTIDRDLLLAGVLFHDCGKIIENQFEPRGFAMPFRARAELFGHIAIGVEILRDIWKKIQPEVPSAPESHTIDCVCHLVLSHHGKLDYGSPVEPKMPEAVLLHYIDQIDAKLEMMFRAFETAREIGDGVVEKTFPMKVNLVRHV